MVKVLTMCFFFQDNEGEQEEQEEQEEEVRFSLNNNSIMKNPKNIGKNMLVRTNIGISKDYVTNFL